MKEVVRKEILKLLEAGIIYPVADSEWESPVHCVPKKGGITVVPNCHAQYATLSKRNSKVPPRIEPHIETLLQGGYHYINIT